jgi:hypothetical protein
MGHLVTKQWHNGLPLLGSTDSHNEFFPLSELLTKSPVSSNQSSPKWNQKNQANQRRPYMSVWNSIVFVFIACCVLVVERTA